MLAFSSIDLLTFVHVAISLAGIVSGFVVIWGLVTGRLLERWTKFFLATTVATSVTGFFFPITHLTPGLVIGVVSLVLLALTIYARYPGRLAGPWRRVYAIGAVVAQYLNFFVLIVQLFQKVPALHDAAPTQSEPPFLVAQSLALALFIVAGSLAAVRFRAPAAGET